MASAKARGVMNPTRLVAYVDVDDTLVRSVGSQRIPVGAIVS